jgi:hypothetical protein
VRVWMARGRVCGALRFDCWEDAEGREIFLLHGRFVLSLHRSSTSELTSVRWSEDGAREPAWIVATTMPRKPAPAPSSRTRLLATRSAGKISVGVFSEMNAETDLGVP